METFSFDGTETSSTKGCDECGHLMSEHDKERTYPDDGPPGSWHYVYVCPVP